MTSLAVTLSFTSSNTPIQSFPDKKKASVFPLMDYKCFLKFHILFSDMHILFFLIFHNLLLFLFQRSLRLIRSKTYGAVENKAVALRQVVITAATAAIGKIVIVRDFPRRRSRRYRRLHRVAERLDRSLPRIIYYPRNVCNRNHFSSPLRQILRLRFLPQPNRAKRSPHRDYKRDKQFRLSLRCRAQTSSLRG